MLYLHFRGGAGDSDSPPPLPEAPPPPLPSQPPPPASIPPPQSDTITVKPPSQRVLHVPGFRSVKPALSPKPVRHNVGGRESPIDLVKAGPTPFKASPAKKEEDPPGYMGLNSSTTAQSRKFKQLQMMVDDGEGNSWVI